jgi:hypothetical protein
MKSKEAIRNTLLAYTNQVWGTRKIERFDLLVQMMIETLTNELYLLQNRLDDIDATMLEKIAQKLTPQSFTSVRPAHTILQMKPSFPIVLLEKSNSFTMEWMPDGFAHKKADVITFYPVAETYLHNIRISHIFQGEHCYSIDNGGKKLRIANIANLRDSIWLGLHIDQNVENLHGLSFYITLPGLSEIHELYEALPYTKCYVNGKEVILKQGFSSQGTLVESDKEILRYYNDNYLRIEDCVNMRDWKQEVIPADLVAVVDAEQLKGNLHPEHWVKLQFPPHFSGEILQDITVAVNTFPVSNKRLIKTTIIKDGLYRTTTLTSSQGEKFLSIESINDSEGRALTSDVVAGSNTPGTFHLETLDRVFVNELGLVDYIERLLDLITDERSVFSGIDKDRVTRFLSSLKKNDSTDVPKSGLDNIKKEEEIAKLSIVPHENAFFVHVAYWVTYGARINNIPQERVFDPDKTANMDGLIATSLCELHGAKEIVDIQQIMSLDRYVFTSKDRIISEYHIKCFCESELGMAVEDVEIKLDGKISTKFKEGLVRVIKINLTPSSKYPDLLYQKGVLKNLKIRLRQRSPEDFYYEINILDGIG